MSDKRKSRQAAEAIKINTHEDPSRETEPDKKAPADVDRKAGKKADKKAAPLDEKVSTTKLEESEKKAGVNYDRVLRISAEFENYKKRKEREAADFRKYANETLVKELLPVVDNLERAMETSADHEDAVNCILEGVDMTLKEISKVLEKFAVKAVEAVGNEFDPTYHQAVMQEASDAHPENTVIKEFQKGYTIHDRLLRPAMVVVAKAASE